MISKIKVLKNDLYKLSFGIVNAYIFMLKVNFGVIK